MKIRTILLTALLMLGLAACSLAEDVTPPPGYVAPTIASSSTPVPPTSTPVTTNAPTDTLEPTATLEPTVTTNADAAVTLETTVAADASATPEAAATGEATSATPEATAIPTGAVSGTVANGSGGALPSGLTVTLRGFDMPADQNSDPTVAVNLPGTVQPDGSYTFENVEILSGRIFLVEITYAGVAYQSGYIIADQPPVSLPTLTIYEVTDDTSLLNLEQVHIAFDYSTPDVVQVIELYIMSNTSTQAVLVTTDGASIPFVHLPEGAANVNFQVASGSAAFVGTETGFALVPLPEGQQYGLVAVFELPYEKKITLTQSFLLAVGKVTIFAPEGVKVRGGDELVDQGLQDFSGTMYQLYEATDVAAGSSLTVTLSGKPEAAGEAATDTVSAATKQWLIIGLGTGGMALVSVGLFLFMRDRKRSLEGEDEEESEEGEEEGEEENASEDDRDAILDAIIALDDQYKAGEISREVYNKRRAELKERLKGIR
ncbi:MAG: cytochrome c family protein [Anaerolineaceae bacterium]|nr:MAG: cytochrome c family protein [Anaerolineaceae bacterium]